MGRYRKIEVRIWNDQKFRSLTSDAKLIFMFLLTHPNMTSLGAMRATIPGMAAEIGTLSKGFGEGFAELSRKGLVECDEEAAFVALPKFLKHNGPENPNVVKSWESCLELIPECHLKYLVLQRAMECVDALGGNFSKGLPIPFRKGMPNPEPEPEPEQEQRKADSSEVAKPPSKPATEVVSKPVPRLESNPEPPAETALTFACVGVTKVYHLVQPQIDAWQADYQNLDVAQECRKAHNWIEASPRNRKTAVGMMKFLVSWLNRATDEPRTKGRNERSNQAGLFGNRDPDPTRVRTGSTTDAVAAAFAEAAAKRGE